jgi:predicted CXXCH cytochrome family protein
MLIMLVLSAFLSLGLVICWWGRSRPPIEISERNSAGSISADDPRRTFPTPYQNVRPEVQYVGDEACAQCHPRIADTYRRHPMGHSLAPISSAAAVERYDESAQNPFQAQGFRYQVQRRGDRVFHQEAMLDHHGDVVTASEAEVHYAVGSNRRGRSYLINRDGRLFESPITWYPQRQRWDLSPSYPQRNRHFSRPIPAECLFCHSNRALEVEETLNAYRPPIFEGHAVGCERCHGPGELHVRRQGQAEAYEGRDVTIVNPRHLEPALREAVCQQCHLQGKFRVRPYGRGTFDYRPGLPWHLFRSVFVQANAPMKFVGQVEQMTASPCYRASSGALGCISCHDPHELPAPERRVAHYRDRCLSCHADRGCGLAPTVRQQRNRDDSCIDCHMPAGATEISHIAITDHRILRHPESEAITPASLPLPRGGIPLVYFHGNLIGPNDAGVARDLAVALMEYAERYPQPGQEGLSEAVLPSLDVGLRAHPDDLEAGHARAVALSLSGRKVEAAAVLEAVLARAPRREVTLHAAAELAMTMGRLPAARNYWERALDVNPYRYGFHYGLAASFVETGSWAAAALECRRGLELNGANLELRQLLVRCHLELGQNEKARVEFQRLLAMNPSAADRLRRWFEEVRASRP